MYVAKSVAFDGINYTPGFPSLSVFGCDPWAPADIGGCGIALDKVGKEPNTDNAGVAIVRAMLAAGVAPPEIAGPMARGVVPASLSGCGCGGKCGPCGGHGLGDFLPDFNAIMADPLTWAKDNAFVLVLGAVVGSVVFGGRRR